MSNGIENKTVWLTGASSGIGEALVHELVKNRNFVIISARSADKLQSLVDMYPDKLAVLPYDVVNDESNATIASRLGDITDQIDALIMCAGTCEYDNGPDFEPQMYKRVMDVNFMGTVNTLHTAKPFLLKAKKDNPGSPHIVAVSSMSSLAAFPRAEVYGASKAAIDYLMECASIDLKKHGVDVTIVRPGFVNTPLTQKNDFPMPWIMQPDEAAAIIIKGMAKKKRYINFPWQLNIVLTLAKIFPSFWVGKIGPKLVKKETI